MSSSKAVDEREIPAAVSRYVRSGVRSRHEALQYLCRRGVPARRAVAVVSACQAQGLLDDRAAARLWADHWARQGYATEAIRLKLADKAFDERDILEAIRPLRASTAEEERARLVLARDARRTTRRLSRARLARVLASRGFDPDLIDRLLEESFGSATPTHPSASCAATSFGTDF
ncbi:MAG: RecX family transcriptional regulator [Candidatus Omnitrophota bacterium]|nr:RecX family transcriptional regulator [Candidatus Omnitrophota bacterium]